MSNSIKPMRVVRGISQSLCIVLLLLTCGALSAQNQEHRVRNIVLVHGAWADGSGWKGVYDILVKDGYNVSIVQEPETSFQDDVAATKRILALQDGPCILVASQLWGSRNYRSGHGSIGCRLGVYRGPHAGFRRERVRRRKALSERPRQVGRHKENARRIHIYRPGAVSRIVRSRPSRRPGRIHGALAGAQLCGQFLSDDHHGCLENQTELDARGGKRSNHQPGLGTLVCQAGQEPHGRSRRRQPLGLRLQAQGGCSTDRRSCNPRSVEELAMSSSAPKSNGKSASRQEIKQ